jgi:hypothetical protein
MPSLRDSDFMAASFFYDNINPSDFREYGVGFGKLDNGI